MSTNHNELRQRLGVIDVELERLTRFDRPTTAQAERAEQLEVERDEIHARIEAAEARLSNIKDVHADNVRSGSTVAGAAFNYISKPSHSDIFERSHGTTDDALRAVDIAAEASVTATGRSADPRPELRSMIERHQGFADHIRTKSDPAYASAFSKLIASGDAASAMLRMTADERDAFTRVAEVESRAAGLGDTSGGYAVPVLLDPSVIYTGDGSANPVREVARIVTGMDDTWRGVSSGGITAEWDSEAQQAPDSTPTLAQPTVAAHKANAFVPFSVEIEGDWQGMAAEMTGLFQEAKDDLEEVAFATGSGTDQPVGILTALFAGSATAGVLPTTDGEFGAVDIYKVFGDLPARYRRNASWMASIDVLNEIRDFDTNGSLSRQTVDLSGGYGFPLLGPPAYEQSGFPAFTGTTGAANIAVVGDFRNYVVFDRVGSRVELVNHLFDSNALRPNGQRGLYFWWRVGADSVNDNGFRLLANA